MNRRLAKKVLGHWFAYPQHMQAAAVRRRPIVPVSLSRAALRSDRVLAHRFEDDASRWLRGDGPPPSLYGTTKQGPPPKRATAP